MRTIEVIILISMIAFCSFYVSQNTMDYTITTRNIVWVLCTIIVFIMMIYRAMGDDKFDFGIVKKMIFPFFAGYIFIMGLSITKAVNFGEGINGASQAFVMMISMFTLIIAIKHKPDMMIKSIVLIALTLGIYGIYQYVTIRANPAQRTGTMANMNLCSSGHVLLIPFSVYALRYSKLWKILGIAAAATALFIILFSLRTRSAWVALFIVGIIAASRTKKTLALTLLAFIILGTAVYLVKGKTIFNTASMNQRFDMWTQSFNMFLDNPLGVGVGNWRVQIPYYARNMSEATRAVAFKTIYFQRPHNDWLWVLAETGIFGFLSYLMIFIMGIYYAVKSKNKLVYCGLTAYAIIAIFSFPKERTFHTIILLFYFALSVVMSGHKIQYFISKRRLYLANVFVLAGLSFSAVCFYERYNTELLIHRAIVARAKGDWKSVYDITESISKFSTLDSYGTPIKYYQGIANYQRKRYAEALEDFEAAVKENPNHIYVLMNLGACYIIHQKFEEAEKCYEKVKAMYPGYVQAQICLDSVRKSKGIKNEKG